MEINYTKPTEYTVNVTCHVEGVYPEPHAEMSMHLGGSDNATVITVQAIKSSKKTKDEIGVYDIQLYHVFEDGNLTSNTHFECRFAIPNTSYTIRNKISYAPGKSKRFIVMT